MNELLALLHDLAAGLVDVQLGRHLAVVELHLGLELRHLVLQGVVVVEPVLHHVLLLEVVVALGVDPVSGQRELRVDVLAQRLVVASCRRRRLRSCPGRGSSLGRGDDRRRRRRRTDRTRSRARRC